MICSLSQKKMKLLFELLEELYHKENNKTGMLLEMPCVVAEIQTEGKFMLYSPHAIPTNEIKKLAQTWVSKY